MALEMTVSELLVSDMLKLRSTGVAATNSVLPAWDARTVQVPTVSKVTVLPLTPLVVQTDVVCEAKLTAKPDVDEALNVIVLGVRLLLPGAVNEMVCAPV